MDTTTDNDKTPKRRIEDKTPAAKIDWTAPGAPAVPANLTGTRLAPFRAVASMLVNADGISIFPTPAAGRLAHGHYVLSACDVTSQADTQRPARLSVDQILDIGERCGLAGKGMGTRLVEFAALVREAEPLRDDAIASRYRARGDNTSDQMAGPAATADGTPTECSGDPSSCPENEGHGCACDYGAPAATSSDAPAALTDDEILSALANVTEEAPKRLPPGWSKFARAIERTVAARIERAAAPAPTEMADRLRRIVLNRGEGSITVQSKLLIQAADECDRFYGGMMAWKRTAEAKDREFAEARAAVSAATKPIADLSMLMRFDVDGRGDLRPRDGGKLCIFADVQSLLATKPAAAPEGAVILPGSPTNEMVYAIEAKIDSQLIASGMTPGDMQREDGADVYAALLAAAPAAPTATPAEQARDAARWAYIQDNAVTVGGGHGFMIKCYVPVDAEDIGCGIDEAIRRSAPDGAQGEGNA